MKPVTHVISVPLAPADAIAALELRAAIDEVCATDGTLGVEIGPANEIVLHGQSELQLEIAVDILKRGKGLVFQGGHPQVHYREAITKSIEWDYTHKKQPAEKANMPRSRSGSSPASPAAASCSRLR